MSQGCRPPPNDPWAQLDGRLNAPAGAAQFPNRLQPYPTATSPNPRYLWPNINSAQPPWHVAGVDYAVGINSGVTLNDPLPGGTFVTASLDPFFKTTLGASINSNGLIQVANQSNFTMQGWDFSLHGGLNVLFQTCSNFTVRDCNFLCASNLLNVPIQLDGGTSNATIEYCVINGNAALTPVGDGLIETNAFGNNVYQYNHIHDGAAELIVTGNSSSGTSNHTIQYNLMYGGGRGNPSSGYHGDWAQIVASATPKNNTTFKFNFIFQLNVTFGTQGLSYNGTPGENFGNDIMQYNTCIADLNSNVNTFFNPDFSGVSGQGLIDTNYCDCAGINGGTGGVNNDTAAWCSIVGGTGGNSNNFTGNNNMNMQTGAKLPTDSTGRVNT